MFSSDADLDRADWPLLRYGAVNLFRKRETVDAVRRDLAELDYEVAELSCAGGLDDFRIRISSILRWEEQFGYFPCGPSLDALNDGFRGYPFGPSRRSALIVDDFHRLVEEDPRVAAVLLDIIEMNARDHLLRGNLLVALIRTDDGRYRAPNIGCRPAHWYFGEIVPSNRGR